MELEELEGFRQFCIRCLSRLPAEVVVRETMNGDAYTAAQMAELIAVCDSRGLDWVRLHARTVRNQVSLFATLEREEDPELNAQLMPPSSVVSVPPELLDDAHWAGYETLHHDQKDTDIVALVQGKAVTVPELLEAIRNRSDIAQAWLLDFYQEFDRFIAGYGIPDEDEDVGDELDDPDRNSVDVDDGRPL